MLLLTCSFCHLDKSFWISLFSGNLTGDNDVFTLGLAQPGPCSAHLAHLWMFGPYGPKSEPLVNNACMNVFLGLVKYLGEFFVLGLMT